MELLQNDYWVLRENRNNPYFCRMEKEFDLTLSETEDNTSIDDFLKRIFEEEHSGEMSYEEFEERLEAYFETHKSDPVVSLS